MRKKIIIYLAALIANNKLIIKNKKYDMAIVMEADKGSSFINRNIYLTVYKKDKKFESQHTNITEATESIKAALEIKDWEISLYKFDSICLSKIINTYNYLKNNKDYFMELKKHAHKDNDIKKIKEALLVLCSGGRIEIQSSSINSRFCYKKDGILFMSYIDADSRIFRTRPTSLESLVYHIYDDSCQTIILEKPPSVDKSYLKEITSLLRDYESGLLHLYLPTFYP